MAIPFVKEFEPHYGELVAVTPLIPTMRVALYPPEPRCEQGSGSMTSTADDAIHPRVESRNTLAPALRELCAPRHKNRVFNSAFKPAFTGVVCEMLRSR
mgnify:CR=1 FL=1